LKSLFMISTHCSCKETEVLEVVGTLTLVITRSRAGESRSSRDLTNKLVTLGSLSPLIFLALPAISGIEFPWSLYLTDLWRRISALFKLPGKANILPDQAKDFSRRSSCLDLLNLSYRRGLGLTFSRPVLASPYRRG